MSVTWIDGREVAKKWKENAAQRTQALIEKGVTPHLAVVVAGENPASQVYVRNKENACNRAGIRSTVLRLPESCTQEELEGAVLALNADEAPFDAHFDAGCGRAEELISQTTHDFGGGTTLAPYTAYIWKMETV